MYFYQIYVMLFVKAVRGSMQFFPFMIGKRLKRIVDLPQQ